jgi:opacity protein-like surface antigen
MQKALSRRPAVGAVRRSALTVVALLAAIALFPAVSAGQDLGVRLGYYAGEDADDPVAVVGVFSRFDIPGPLNLEVSADYRRETLLDGDIEAMVIPLRVSALFNFLPGLSPYLVAGAGADYVDLDYRNGLAGFNDESDLVFEVHAGAGIEIGLGPVSLGADLRYCRATGLSSDALSTALGHDYDPSGWSATLTAGFSF